MVLLPLSCPCTYSLFIDLVNKPSSADVLVLCLFYVCNVPEFGLNTGL